MAATLTLNSSAFSPFLPGYTMHPLRMNPPTPIQAHKPHLPKHLLLVAGEYRAHPAARHPPRTSSLKAVIQPAGSSDDIPSWQYLPGTTTIFGSSRARKSLEDLKNESARCGADAGETVLPKQVSQLEHQKPDSNVLPQTQAGQTEPTHRIKRKPLPPLSGPAPTKPLPALPCQPIQREFASMLTSRLSTSRPALLAPPAEKPIVTTATATARTLKEKVSQHLKLPPPIIIKPKSSFLNLLNRALPPSPPSTPESPLFDLRTKKTQLRVPTNFRSGLLSCFERSGAVDDDACGGVDEDAEGLEGAALCCTPFSFFSSATTTTAPSPMSPQCESQSQARRQKVSKHTQARRRLHRLRRKSREMAVRLLDLDSVSSAYGLELKADLIWEANATARHADEGRWLPVPYRAMRPVSYGAWR